MLRLFCSAIACLLFNSSRSFLNIFSCSMVRSWFMYILTSNSCVTYLRFLSLISLSLAFVSLSFTIIGLTFPSSNLPIRYKVFSSCFSILFSPNTSCRTLKSFLQLSNWPYKAGFPKVGDIAPLGAILVSRGAITNKGTKRGAILKFWAVIIFFTF